MPHLKFWNSLIIEALRAAQKEAIALLKAILDKEEALLRTEETNKVKQSQAVEEREELVRTVCIMNSLDSN